MCLSSLEARRNPIAPESPSMKIQPKKSISPQRHRGHRDLSKCYGNRRLTREVTEDIRPKSLFFLCVLCVSVVHLPNLGSMPRDLLRFGCLWATPNISRVAFGSGTQMTSIIDSSCRLLPVRRTAATPGPEVLSGQRSPSTDNYLPLGGAQSTRRRTIRLSLSYSHWVDLIHNSDRG